MRRDVCLPYIRTGSGTVTDAAGNVPAAIPHGRLHTRRDWGSKDTESFGCVKEGVIHSNSTGAKLRRIKEWQCVWSFPPCGALILRPSDYARPPAEPSANPSIQT